MQFFVGQEYNCLIDGGHAKHLSNIESCMDEYDVMNRHGIQLHGIIVTHPDSDHLNGVTELLEKHRHRILNNYDVFVTEAFYWKSKHNVCTKFLQLMDKVYPERYIITGGTTCLRPGLNCYFPKEPGCLLRCMTRDGKGRCIQSSEIFLKENPKHVDANETSILTVINQSERKCDAVLTGDSTAEEILPLVEGKEIGIFQVPHHGSISNSRLKDKCKLVEYSGQCDLSIVHNEVRETLLFYSTFRAQCYLISAGGNESYKHPHPHVLQGIILANSLRHQECVIVLTNSRGLNSEKLKQLHVYRLVPQWTRYVKIYHYDDIFFTEQCHASLRPEKCISDVRAKTVEWTPEGYISRTRIMLPVKPTISDSRPLEKNRFMEKSTVEVTIQGTSTFKFNAHIICVPLPHNPRSGDSINCCYIIEESIVSGTNLSKALFLLNEDKTLPLSRAKKYILFQYINNEWQKKQLHVTLKDILSQTSPCHIPYDDIKSLFPVQESSTQISPHRSNHQRINFLISSLQPAQNISPQALSSRIPHQSTNSVRPVQGSSSQTPPSHIPHQNLQPLQNISPQTPPNRIPYQSTTSVQPQTPPSHINSLQPLPPQASLHNIQQLHPDINSLQIGGEGATVATSNHAGVDPYVLQHRVQAAQQCVVRPSPAQYYGQYESPTNGCRCQKTDCTTNRCGCKKQGSYCGPNCRCSGCKNNQQYVAFQVPQHQLTVTPGRMKQAEVKLSPTKGCGCKTGCGTMRCGCKKQGQTCGPSCKCKNTYFNCTN